ncbi:sodium-coupled monocarboxylate transporter 2 [Aplysia californica]|uniref:Sodium-coupled monocarboxylate transporter 2 n=1 Tax=Aplysia californica TaxID=6500 RepID=A0ABM1A1A8_APLCA|nr:sodium-coupled monocarboxylate transporter 2 [Aplysia californica]
MGSNSIETGEIRKFSGVDYAVFIVLLVIFSVVGLYHAINDRRRKKENPNEFLLGGRSMSVFPVAMSLTVTFMSALTILGTPVEMYVYNTMFMYLMLALVLAMCSAGIIFIPFFYKLGVTSTFQVVYMSFVLYAPCLALSAVTGLNLWGCVVGVCVVVTFYTTLGGMKAVIWTDTLQFLIMIAGLLAVFIKGCMETGGFSAAWDVAEREGRVKFDDFSFDPATRHSFWSVVVGGGILWTVGFGVNQAQVQRCLSTSSVRKAQLAILVNTPGLVSIVLLTCLIGIVVFSFYLNCDPIKLGIIEKRDQLLPLFVMDVLGDLKGIPGLFVSCTISGSLRQLSDPAGVIPQVHGAVPMGWSPNLCYNTVQRVMG